MSLISKNNEHGQYDFHRGWTSKIEEILERCSTLEIEIVALNKGPRKSSSFTIKVHPSHVKISADEEMIIDLKSIY